MCPYLHTPILPYHYPHTYIPIGPLYPDILICTFPVPTPLSALFLLQVQEVGEGNLKIGILEKKFENVEGECLKRIEVEKMEALKYQAAMETEKK